MSETKLLEDLKEYGASNRLYNAMNFNWMSYDFILPDPTKCKKLRNFGGKCYEELIQFLLHKKLISSKTYALAQFSSPKDVVLFIKLPLGLMVSILNPTYIPKLKETFGLDFNTYINDSEKVKELWKMDDEAPFEVSGYYTRMKKHRFEIHIEVH